MYRYSMFIDLEEISLQREFYATFCNDPANMPQLAPSGFDLYYHLLSNLQTANQQEMRSIANYNLVQFQDQMDEYIELDQPYKREINLMIQTIALSPLTYSKSMILNKLFEEALSV